MNKNVCECCINSEKSIFEDGNDCMFCGECHDKFESKYCDEFISNMLKENIRLNKALDKACHFIDDLYSSPNKILDFEGWKEWALSDE